MLYIKDSKIISAGTPITIDDTCIINPTPETYAAAGWVEFIPEAEPINIHDVQEDKIDAIREYDNSPAVNGFTLGGQHIWLDKATRVGLVNALQAALALGDSTTQIGLGEQSYTVDCQTALTMLYHLEAYALKCYNQTLAHIAAVRALDDADAIQAYDHTTGYPEQPEFPIPEVN